jgi:hypothetical protein
MFVQENKPVDFPGRTSPSTAVLKPSCPRMRGITDERVDNPEFGIAIGIVVVVVIVVVIVFFIKRMLFSSG